jgi:microcompartment protein CcmL/EutN
VAATSKRGGKAPAGKAAANKAAARPRPAVRRDEGEASEPRSGPALGLLELSSVARGMVVADAMVKRAAVRLLRAHPVTPGKYVVVVGGGEEEVAQAMAAGLEASAGTLIDRMMLSKADPQLGPAMTGSVQVAEAQVEALGIVETFSVASAVLAADRAVKAAEVRLVQLRLARWLGGRAFFVLTGELHQLEAAIDAGRTIIHDGMLLSTEIIARPHPDLVRAVVSSV